MPNEILELPFSIQLMLGSGYVAYLIAYSGIREHHTTTDVIFRTLAFGLVTTATLTLVPEITFIRSAVAFIATALTGAFWRWKAMHWAQALLSFSKVSWSDDLPTAWLSITAKRTDFRPSQVAVDLDDGRILLCENTRDYVKAPFGPCMFGPDGSVALYVSAEMRADGTWVEHTDILHDKEGAKITYIPSSFVKRVEIRHWSDLNEKAASVVAETGEEAD